VNNVRICTLL